MRALALFLPPLRPMAAMNLEISALVGVGASFGSS